MNRVFNQRLQRVSLRWWVHAQQSCTVAPALQVLLQELRLTVADQHGFKEAIGQEQGAVVEGKLQACSCSPLTLDPGDGGAHASGGHASASSKGCSFHINSSASPRGSESATIPQPAWARRVSPWRSKDRIKMLLSKLPSQSTRSSDPQ